MPPGRSVPAAPGRQRSRAWGAGDVFRRLCHDAPDAYGVHGVECGRARTTRPAWPRRATDTRRVFMRTSGAGEDPAAQATAAADGRGRTASYTRRATVFKRKLFARMNFLANPSRGVHHGGRQCDRNTGAPCEGG